MARLRSGDRTRGAAGLWLRWSWRDLRRRWILVVAIALVIAIGTGVYAGLGSTARWRRASNDASYSALRMHDLRVTLPEGSLATEGELATVARSTPHADAVGDVVERLILPTQVDASTAQETVLAPGRIVGLPTPATGLAVDRLDVEDGDDLDARADEVVIEEKWADQHGLASTGTIRLAGDTEVDYRGVGVLPEDLLVTTEREGLLASLDFAVIYAPLGLAQRLTGHEDGVNDAVLRLRPGADRDMVRDEMEQAFASLGATVATRDDDPAYTALYEDIENDQQFWNLIAVLILLGAAFAAFNLMTRIVEAERREIGVGMALGVEPRVLAIRPLLVGVQVALVGAFAGVAVGYLVSLAMRSLLTAVLPLPEWRTPFQLGPFVQGLALGVSLPIVGTLIPLRRAVRLEPVEAIHPMRRAAAGGAGWHRRGPRRRPGRLARLFPARTTARMPFRNLRRARRRTALTALGIAAAMTVLVAVLGMVDSMFATVDRGRDELTHQAPDRYLVSLDFVYPTTGGGPVAAVADSPVVGEAETGLVVVGTVRRPGDPTGSETEIPVLPEVRDLRHAMWTPTLADAVGTGTEGIVLSRKAASDLGVEPGDTVVLRHPRRQGASYELVDTELTVTALHEDPLRMVAFLDADKADLFGLEGMANVVIARPAAGVSSGEFERALFTTHGVASVRNAAEFADLVEDRIGDFTAILRIAEAAVLALALLIAFNSASLAAEERAREEATMLAYGLPVRTVLRMAVTESGVLGLLGTAIGIAGGVAVLSWLLASLDDTMPELGMVTSISGATVVLSLALGVLAVGAAPLLTARRLVRMDVPSALRTLE